MRFRLLVFVVIHFCAAFSLFGQSRELQIYRVCVTDVQQIETLRQFNFAVAGTNFGRWVDLICSDAEAKLMQEKGLSVEKISSLQPQESEGAALDGFHNYAETREFLHQIARDYPAITRLDSLGASVQNRGLWALKISDNPDADEDEPCLLIEGCIHGNENHALEVCLYFIQYMVENYGVNPEVTHWVENREIWVVPLVNPDGHEAQRRYNANNVDLNRNFGYWWGFTASRYGSAPFSEPETQAIRDLALRIKPYGSLAFHTSGRVILYPWAYRSTPVAPDDALFQETARELVDSINVVDPSIQYDFRRSGTWYWHGGEHNDWMYSQYGMLSFTIELMTSQSAPPSEHENEVVLPAFRVMLRRPERAGITGKIVAAATGLPLSATFKIDEIFDAEQLVPRVSDSLTGRFIRFLPQGNFTFETHVPGYTKFVKPITIAANDTIRVLEVFLEKGADLALKNSMTYDSGEGSIFPNGILNRGEIAQLNLKIENIGSLASEQVLGTLTSESQDLTLIENDLSFGTVAAGEEKFATSPITVSVSDQALPGQKIPLELQLRDLAGNQWTLSFALRVQGFFDDMEKEGRDQWTHHTFGDSPNSHDDWQYGIPGGESGDPGFAHSPQFVWGNDLGSGSWNGAYQNNQHNYLQMRPLNCRGWQNVYLQFYRWLRINSGDEAYITVNGQIVWTNYRNEIKDRNWNFQLVDISSVAADLDSVVIQFCLQSNNSGASGGWTIDDVMVDEQILLLVKPNQVAVAPEKYQLLPNYPNPFHDVTQIHFSLSKPVLVDLAVFNVLGQSVKTIVSSKLPAGNYLFPWNGTDDRNHAVSTGVYLIQLKVGQQVFSNKIMHVRDE
ncbi:MAG: DUF2817 domain-containing protein [Calditrichaeota bacterium]|nr:DUF2817 domain-containing protein [Calditrichota bacterium]